MLARAAARSLRIQLPTLPVLVLAPVFQTRTYAKNQPKLPYRNPNSSHSPRGKHGATTRKPTLSSERDQSPKDYSELQEEFESSAPNDGNTAPRTTSPSAVDPAEVQKQKAERNAARGLPDLTQGIPSTLESELAYSSAREKPIDLNIIEDPTGRRQREDRALPESDYIAASERKRNTIANWFFAVVLGLGISGTVYWGRNWATREEELRHPDAPSGWGLGLFYNRAKARLTDRMDYYNEPTFEKLLPNPDPQWARPYTLVLSLQDLLVHSEWTREHGWRMAKRPGVDYFLRYLSNYYELVIFTDQPSMIASPVIAKLDPFRIVMWPLFREATKYRKGEYIKDLAYLNRDLSKVIMLDTVSAHAKAQPENAIILPKWKGDLQDKGLVSFIPFLEYCATLEVDDTRKAIQSFEGTYIPAEFAKREAKEREKLQERLVGEKRPRRSIGWLSNALGMKPQSPIEGLDTFSEGLEKGKTYQDQMRERGQKQYEMLEREIRENGDKWLKSQAEDEKKATEEAMKGMKAGISNYFPFGGGAGKSG